MEKITRQSVSNFQNAKVFLDSIVKKYIKFDKVEKGHYLSLLEKTIYDEMSSVQEHIMKLVLYHRWLKSMKNDLRDSFLI